MSGSVVAVAVCWTDIKTSLKTNTLQVVLPDRFMPLSLKKALPASTQSLKIIVVVFVKHKQKKATIRVEHTIGLSAQVDWKEQVTMTDRNGVSYTFSIFLYVLPYFKFKFLKLTLDQKQDTLFKCLGVRTLFINCHELILRLKAVQEKQHLERVMRRYERYDLLIIDELGYLPISANESKLLFQLINGRYERKSTIITNNVPLSSWGTVLNSTATAEAILERLVYHSHVIKIKGKSYRLASVSS